MDKEYYSWLAYDRDVRLLARQIKKSNLPCDNIYGLPRGGLVLAVSLSIPVIAEALDRYEGAMVLVSHAPEFVQKIKIDYILNLEAL